MFQHTESARQHAKKLILFGFCVLIFCIGFLLLIFSQESPNYILVFVLGLCAIPGLLMVITAMMQFMRGGEWDISIDADKLKWTTPEYLGESFEYALDDIAYIEKLSRVNKGSKNNKIKSRYFLVTKMQERHELKKQSSIDLEGFVAAAVRMGVELNEVSA